jgi:hypothetical protein
MTDEREGLPDPRRDQTTGLSFPPIINETDNPVDLIGEHNNRARGSS